MIKLVCFVKRKPGMDRDDFHRHWAESHGPLIAGCDALARHIHRYEQHSRLDSDYTARGEEDFDGVTIQWFDSMKAFGGFVRDPAYAELVAPDEVRFLDRGGLGLLFTEEGHRVIDGPREAAGAKLLCLLRRRDGMEPAAFHRHWREVHGPLFRAAPDIAERVLAYQQSPRLESDYAREDAAWDGLAEQWYSSADDLAAMVRSAGYRERVVPDEERLIDRAVLRYVVTGPERVIIG